MRGGTRPFEYSFDGGASFNSSSSYNRFDQEQNTVIVRDGNGCTSEININFQLLQEFEVELNGDLINCPGEQSAFLNVSVANGLRPYEYALNNLWSFQDESEFYNLTSGAYTLRIRDDNGCTKDTILFIDEQPTYESFILNTEKDTCISGVGGAIIEEIFNGHPPYTYSLDGVNFQNSPNFDNLSFGDHNLFIRDGNLCISEETFRLDSVHTVKINADESQTTCGEDNGTIALSTSSQFGNEYYFNGSQVDTTVFTDLPADTYNVLVVDRYGCRDSVAINILDSDIPRVNQTISDNRCANDEAGSISLVNVNNINSYSYTWSNGATTSNISSLKNGTYTVTIEDEIGCQNILSYEINSPDSIEINSVTTIRSCPDAPSGELSVVGTGGFGQLAYSIDGGVTYHTQSTFSNLHSGEYLINVRDANGCTQEMQTTIEEYAPYAGINVQVEMDTCASGVGSIIIQEILAGEGPYSFSLDGTSFTSETEIEQLPYGDYQLHIQDGNNCVWREDFSVDSILLIHIGADQIHTTCGEDNGEIEINASSNNNNTYYLNGVSLGNNPSADNLPAGRYTLLAINQYGCQDAIELDILDSDIPRVTGSIIDNPCSYSADGNILLESILPQTNYNYTWSHGPTTSEVNGLANGEYKVTIVDAIGCENILDFQITSPDSIEMNVSGVFYNCPGFSEAELFINATGGLGTLEYSINGGANYTSNTDYTSLPSGEYSISVKDANQCIKEAQITIEDHKPYDAIDLHVEMDTCTHSKGGIYVEQIVSGTGPFYYSLDGTNFQPQPEIENLPYGAYQLYIQDGNGCIWNESFSIDSIFTLHVEGLVEHTFCNEENGKIEIISSSAFDNNYSLNANTSQSQPIFENLPPGNFDISVENIYGCRDTINLTINESRAPIIDAIDVSYSSCVRNNNAINISATSGNPPFQYSLDNAGIISEPTFNDLDPGVHILKIIDEENCEVTADILIEEFESITIQEAIATDPKCDQADGEVLISATGGAGPLTVDYLDQTYILSDDIEDLDRGLHTFLIKDTTDCTLSLDVELTHTCNFYIPNIFSPDGDGQEDYFEIFFSEGAEPTIDEFAVYDRWGELVFSLEESTAVRWDGKFRSQDLSQGVYTYVLNGQFKNGQPIKGQGTITLIK